MLTDYSMFITLANHEG